MATVQELKSQGFIIVGGLGALINRSLDTRVRVEQLRANVEADFPSQTQIIADLAELRDNLDMVISTINQRLNDLTGILAQF